MTTDHHEPAASAGTSLASIGAGLSVAVIFMVFLSLPVEAARRFDFDPEQTAAWIFALWAIPGVAGLVLSIRDRVPLVMTGNLFVMILVVRVAGRYEWSELVGAAILAGIVILMISRTGSTERLSRWIPPSIIYGLLAGAVLPFMVDMFTLGSDEPIVVFSAVTAYLATRLWRPGFPAIIPAVVVAAIAVAATGDLVSGAFDIDLVMPTLTTPTFDLAAVLGITPIVVILVTIQSNVPSIVFLREQGYEVSPTAIGSISGVGTTIGSLLGPIGMSLALPLTAVTAVPDAGPTRSRYRAGVIAGIAAIAIGVLAGVALAITSSLSPVLIAVAIGLAFLGVIVNALGRMTADRLQWGPVITFIVAASDLTVLGLSSFFWAIVIGVTVASTLDGRS